MRILIGLLFLAACDPVKPHVEEPPSYVAKPVVSTTAEVVAEPPAPEPDVAPVVLCPEQRQRLDELKEARAELDGERREWLAAHCKSIAHTGAGKDMSGNTIYEGPSTDTTGWLECDGHLTNAPPKSNKAVAIDGKIVTMGLFLNRCCVPNVPQYDCKKPPR